MGDWRRTSGLLAPGVLLDPVIAVVAAPPQKSPKAGRHIGGQEQRAPALGLPDVGQLVRPRAVQAGAVPPEHDVAARRAPRSARGAAQENPGEPAPDLEHAV